MWKIAEIWAFCTGKMFVEHLNLKRERVLNEVQLTFWGRSHAKLSVKCSEKSSPICLNTKEYDEHFVLIFHTSSSFSCIWRKLFDVFLRIFFFLIYSEVQNQRGFWAIGPLFEFFKLKPVFLNWKPCSRTKRKQNTGNKMLKL